MSITTKKIMLAAALAWGVFLPIIVSAIPNTVDEIRLQIADLTKRIEELKKQLAELEKEKPIAWCHTFNKNLKIGDRGVEVEALRYALLKDQGSQAENFDDVFNEFVASWVTSFQEKYKDEILMPVGLAHGTGYVGPATRKKLNALYGCAVPITEKNGYLYLVPDSIKLKVGETQEIKAYYQPPMPQCASGYACIQIMPVAYRVPAKFSSDNLEVVDIAIAIPMCIPANPASGNYCGEMAIVQGKKIGSATITATYNGLFASAKAEVK